MALIESERLPWWKWLSLSLGVIVVSVLVSFVGLVALIFHEVDFRDYLEVAHPPWITNGWVGFWIAVIILSQSLAPVGALALVRSTRRLAFGQFRLPADLQRAAWQVLLGGCLALGLQWLWTAIGPTQEDPYRLLERFIYAVAHGRAVWPWFWLLLTAVVVGPLAEEILFRGFILGKLRQRWGRWAGLLGSAVLFGLAHGLINALPAALLGLYFAWQTERDQSLAGAVVLHSLHNLVAVLVIAFG